MTKKYLGNHLMRTVTLAIAIILFGVHGRCAAQQPSGAGLVALPPAEKEPLQLASYLSPTKSGFRVTPYGIFWSDMIYATQRTNPGSFSLFVLSPEDQGESAFTLDARRSRFGIKVSGPSIPTAEPLQSSGRVEVDFEGNFIIENRAEVLLRHAYWEAHNDRHRFLVGQHWDVVSPLIPRTVNYGAGYLAGNPGFRRAQFRYERFVALSEQSQLTLQGSLNQDIVADFAADPGVRRESADWPVIQARAAVSLNPKAGRDSATLGVSGHLGETGFDFLVAGPPPLSLPPQDDARFESWSYNIDLAFPLGERTHLQAEFFQGANLSPILAGIGQGVCPCLRKPVRSLGGWVDVQYLWTPQLRSHVGYGIDDPSDEDILFGRISNQFLFVNLIWDVTPQLSTGYEVTYWKTHYQETRAGLIPPEDLAPTALGESVVFDFNVKYSF